MEVVLEEKKKRWSMQARKEVVLRILSGESIEDISRELEVEVFRLEEWRDSAVSAMDDGLKGKGRGKENKELDEARKTIGRLTMELELFRGKAKRRIR
jgi:transposase